MPCVSTCVTQPFIAQVPHYKRKIIILYRQSFGEIKRDNMSSHLLNFQCTTNNRLYLLHHHYCHNVKIKNSSIICMINGKETGNRMIMEMCRDSLDVRREESWFHIVRLLSVPTARLSLHPYPAPPGTTEGTSFYDCVGTVQSLYILLGYLSLVWEILLRSSFLVYWGCFHNTKSETTLK